MQQIISQHRNLYCVPCAGAIQDYLIRQGISGKRIKLYTGSVMKPNNYILDDSVPNEAISENGRHEAVSVVIDSQEIVFDNHHPEGLPKLQWLANLQFHNKMMLGWEFQITEEVF
ncbi:hypothetical protein K9N68_25880 [Kovacikia minuta CCNUW1]|nr:hypothetical protein K9N68_25880 [Kovacikia minuta CCNUW1]